MPDRSSDPASSRDLDASAESSLLLEFRTRLMLDLATGVARPLAEYLALYPGRDAAVAAIYCECAAPSDQAATEPPRERAEPDSSRRIGPYRIERELGRGGQGGVFLAVDQRLGRRVALKLVPHSRFSAEPSARFRREAEVTAALDHPSLCAVYDVGSDAEGAWLAMRYVEGETLAARLARETRLPMDEALRLAESAARALDEAHRRGVVHRDVKPSNLMRTPNGEVVVLDFGVAFRALGDDRLTLDGEALGTPPYMAPEVLALGAAAATARTDVWSLAVTLYEMLAGDRPFAAPTRESLFDAIRNADPVPLRSRLPAAPRDLERVIATALSKDPNERYASAADFAEDLRRVRAREPIRARPPTARERLSRFYRRDPRFAWMLTIVAVVAIVAFAITTGLLRRTRDTLARYTQLSDQTVARELLEEIDTLWPSDEERATSLARWLERARVLEAKRADYLAAANDGATAKSDPWLFSQLRALIEDLDRVTASVPRIAARLDFATNVTRRTITDPEPDWRAARERVGEDPRFSGFDLAPQLGLVPLGPDPVSRFEEFAVLESGVPPGRDDDGRLVIDADSALVLVLLPGGEVTIGAEPPSAARPIGSPHVDENAGPYDGPIQRVRLDPYFLSKYELTQAQYARLTGANPSYYRHDASVIVDAARAPLHPVEQVAPSEFDRVLAFWRLSLPTEAQWEFAARAGSTTPYAEGAVPESLAGIANVADAAARRRAGHLEWGFTDALDDGHVCHAPIGSFRPNRFGFFDTHGNVAEFCRDTFEDWREIPPRDGDGLRTGKYASRVYRGGTFNRGAPAARIAMREGWNPEDAASSFGARPARAVMPAPSRNE